MEDWSNVYWGCHGRHLFPVLDEEQLLIIKNEYGSRCMRCRICAQDVESPPFWVCHENCGVFLHKVCAHAPSELNHPFHPNHPLTRSHNPPFKPRVCKFCNDYSAGDNYTYDCSCGLVFHIRCALFTFDMAHNNFKHLESVPLKDPFISTTSPDFREKCFLCRIELGSYTHFSPDCGLNLHKKCVELPPKLNHRCHRKHPLVLAFDSENLLCKICEEVVNGALCYVCSPCKFAIHIKCVSPSPTIEHKSHPHPFSLLLLPGSFTCNACGLRGDHVAYTCLTCSILVHQKCISLPRFIRSDWHDHRVSHTYSHHKESFTSSDCIICHDEVNTDYGSFRCKVCNVMLHARCAIEDKDSYEEFSDDEESLEHLKSFTVIETNDAGEATVIEHCKHIGHRLMLSDRVKEYDDNCCDGCLLPISGSFYYCSQGDFLLHKICAELPKEKRVWHHQSRRCRNPFILTSNEPFVCEKCECFSNAFSYASQECKSYTCLRCVNALTPGARTHPGHEHPLYFHRDYKGTCKACGNDEKSQGLFRCKKCDLCLDHKCFSLPITARHKCDVHRLSLTNHDDNSYPESHFCDICEEGRDTDQDRWVYHCATCDTCAHVKCVIDPERSFIKIGSSFDKRKDRPFTRSDSEIEFLLDLPPSHFRSSFDEGEDHPHPLTVVKKIYYYPNCSYCGEPCLDLSLECGEPGCNYNVHFKCSRAYLSVKHRF